MAVGEEERDEHSLKEESLAGAVCVFWECLKDVGPFRALK